MPGTQIKTPTNQKLLTNVAVVRMKKNGKRFEIACYKNKVTDWRNKTEKSINEVLQTDNVFINVSKGQLAKRDDLLASFGTEDQLEVCKMILEKGDLQVSDKERQVHSEGAFKEVATMISNMCVNPETKRPYPASVIEKALHDHSGFGFKPNRSSKQHALEAIPLLRETMKIERAKMRVRVSIPSKNAKAVHDKLKGLFDVAEEEDWEKGDLVMVGLIPPGNYKAVMEIVQSGDRKSHGELELLSLKVVGEVEGENAI